MITTDVEIRISADNHDRVRLNVLDERAQGRILSATFSLEELGRLLSQQAVKCEAQVQPEIVGLRHEWKTVKCETEEEMRAHEVDGWEARESDFGNYHYYRNGKFLVHYDRRVPDVDSSH